MNENMTLMVNITNFVGLNMVIIVVICIFDRFVLFGELKLKLCHPQRGTNNCLVNN
jgi:hypothetical protein